MAAVKWLQRVKEFKTVYFLEPDICTVTFMKKELGGKCKNVRSLTTFKLSIPSSSISLCSVSYHYTSFFLMLYGIFLSDAKRLVSTYVAIY